MWFLRFIRSINRHLITVFDKSRIGYMFLVFPAYQFLAFSGVVVVILSFQAAETSIYFVLLRMFLTIVVGLLLFASWYLSCLLFAMGVFEFLAVLGLPMMPWAKRRLSSAVNWFRTV